MRTRLAQSRIGTGLLALWGVVIGVAPHVLHHAGPLAGAALLAGAGGKLLFGAIGFAISIPFLLRLYRRFQSLVAPVVAAGAFLAIFLVSSVVVSPLISGANEGGSTPGRQVPVNHASHHGR